LKVGKPVNFFSKILSFFREFFKSDTAFRGQYFSFGKGNKDTFSPFGLKIFGFFRWKVQWFFPIEISFQVKSEVLSNILFFFAKSSPSLKLPKNAVQHTAHKQFLFRIQCSLS